MPAGATVRGEDGREWSNPDPADVVRATNASGHRHAVDENHSIDKKGAHGEPSPATGWFDDVRLNDNGEIVAPVQWTPRGQELLAGGSYGFISPVFTFDRRTRRVLKIVRASLTNSPNFTQMTALNHEEDSMELPATIIAALGLNADATEAEVVTAINTLKTPAATATNGAVDLALYAPRADLQQMEARALNAEQALAERNKEDLRERAERLIDEAINSDKPKIAPSSRDAYLAMCNTEEGLQKVEAILKTQPPILSNGSQVPTGAPGSETDTALNAAERQVAEAAGLSDKEWAELKELA